MRNSWLMVATNSLLRRSIAAPLGRIAADRKEMASVMQDDRRCHHLGFEGRAVVARADEGLRCCDTPVPARDGLEIGATDLLRGRLGKQRQVRTADHVHAAPSEDPLRGVVS